MNYLAQSVKKTRDGFAKGGERLLRKAGCVEVA